MSGGGSSGKNYYGFGKGKGGRKGDPIIWEGPLGPDSFPELVFEFPPQHKSKFTNETLLQQYDNRREPWPKYRHGEDCLVQMCTDGMNGGRRFFKCPHAWVILGYFISCLDTARGSTPVLGYRHWCFGVVALMPNIYFNNAHIRNKIHASKIKRA